MYNETRYKEGEDDFIMRVPRRFVGAVDSALRREGLDVFQYGQREVCVIDGEPPADVPPLLAWSRGRCIK